MTRTKKILAALIVALMVIAVLPVASLAEEAALKIDEVQTEAHWQKVWAPLNKVEAEMLAAGATPAECTLAVYKAALVNPDIDQGSISDLDNNAFSFRTKGMCGGYDYKVRNIPHVSSITPEVVETIAAVAAARANATRATNCPTSANVLLVNPYYGYDSSFTNQYITEAQSLANATGGTYTALTGTNATGPNIAAAYTDKGIVIYDSHGNCISSNQTSYLDLRSSSGLTSTDYSNGWAYNGSSFYGIDGRYIKNHASGTLSNCMVWMAICEGMKKEGKGTTGTALLQAGAAVVYGYSQSVSFTGDYKYEATFWTQMKNGATVASAIATMKSTHGNWDPAYSSSSGAAWPIVMSSVDSFPSNPDGTQTVYSDWTMFPAGSTDPDPITSVSVANVNVVTGGTAQVQITVNPSTADYTVTSYASSNTSVATVNSSGVVTGVAAGTSTLTVKVKDNTNNSTYTKTATITVEDFEGYALVDTIEDGGTYIIVANNSISGTTGYAVGNYVISSKNYYLAPVQVTINSDNTCTVSSSNEAKVQWVASGNATNGYSFYNNAVGKYMGLDSSQYLNLTSTALAWKYTSSSWLDNQTDTDQYYYLSYNDGSDSVGIARYTTSKTSTTNDLTIKFYKLITSSTPEPTYYTVTFKDWDGTVLSTQQVVEGGAATAPANPTRTGYTFTGWDKTFNNITADTVVTAQYTINSYALTIYYKYANGTTAASTYTQNYNYGATYSVNSPAITGYTASQAVVSGTMGANAVTVTVTYTANSYPLTIYYKYADGTTAASTYTQNYTYGASYSVTSPVITGYTASQAVVSGTMGAAAVTVTVTYTANEPDPTTLIGDVNCDGTVDFADISFLYMYLLGSQALTAQGEINADVTGNGVVDFGDISALYALLIG